MPMRMDDRQYSLRKAAGRTLLAVFLLFALAAPAPAVICAGTDGSVGSTEVTARVVADDTAEETPTPTPTIAPTSSVAASSGSAASAVGVVETGDNSLTEVYVLLCVAAAATVCAVIWSRHKSNPQDHHCI